MLCGGSLPGLNPSSCAHHGAAVEKGLCLFICKMGACRSRTSYREGSCEHKELMPVQSLEQGPVPHESLANPAVTGPAPFRAPGL